MKKSRRQFIKASAAIGMLGASEASARTAKRRRPFPSSLPEIGLVHTTDFNSKQKKEFLQALTDSNLTEDTDFTFTPKPANDAYGYGATFLEDTVGQFIKNNVALIVAAGGLRSGLAAANTLKGQSNKTIPFIFLVGAQDSGLDYNNSGGIDLNTPGQNEDRFKKLQEKDSAVTAANVGLIVNDNAAIPDTEINLWTSTQNNHQADLVVHIFSSKGNDYSQLVSEFKSKKDILAKAKGIVVSSDPFFRQFRSAFDSALRDPNGGNFTGWVCYPFNELPNTTINNVYADSSPPLSSTGTNGQPSAYYKLGLKAAYVLKNKSDTTPIPNAKITQWNGSTWIDT